MDKKYYDTIDSLKPSASAVDNAVKAALEAEQSGKVIEMKTNNRKRFTIAGVIAASLAAVIALGAVFFPSAVKTTSPSENNSLILKVNAAEISEKDFKPVAKLKRDGGSHVSVWYDDKSTAKPDIEVISYDYKFALDCKGAKEYTCEVTNGSFLIENPDYLADTTPAEKLYKADTEKEYYSYTVGQSSKAKNADIRLVTAVDLNDASPAVKNSAGLNENVYYDKNYGKEDVERDMTKALTNAFENLEVKVTAHFENGKTAEKTISFKPEVKILNFEKIHDVDGSYAYDYDAETVVMAKIL